MILTLLRRDPALRVLPAMVLGFAFLGWMTAPAPLDGAPATGPLDAQDLTVNLFMITAWALINYFAVGKMHEIASPFEMAMPIDARTLWATRVVSMTATVCGGVVGFCSGFVLAHDRSRSSPSRWRLAFNIAAFVVLIPFVYTSVRIREPKWGMPLPVFLPLVAALAYGYIRSGLDTSLPGVVALGSAAILGGTTYRRGYRSASSYLPNAAPPARSCSPDSRSSSSTASPGSAAFSTTAAPSGHPRGLPPLKGDC